MPEGSTPSAGSARLPRSSSHGGQSTGNSVAEVSCDEGGSCGWFCFQPRMLQRTRTAKWLLFWLCCAAAAQGIVVNGFVNVSITTIERRYKLTSTDAGIIAGAYDIASVLCAVPVSYLGSRPGASKPRWLGWGVFIMAIGSFVFALPHFTAPSYRMAASESNSSQTSQLCSREKRSDLICGAADEGRLSEYRLVFVLGQLLHGVGASPLYTLGITYIDDSCPLKMSSLYLGIFLSMAVLGPAVGYVVGSEFLEIFIEPSAAISKSSEITSSNPQWLGAWWIGFVLSACLLLFLSWPIMAFPARLPGAGRKSETEESIRAHADFGRLRDFPSSTKSLLKNTSFLCISLAGATEGILLSGFATFLPKFIESQFSVASSIAGLLVGIVAVPAGGGGTLLGGWLIKKLNLNCLGSFKFCFIVSSICTISTLSFLVSCQDLNFAGVTDTYTNISGIPAKVDLIGSCNEYCNCLQAPYSPVCGSNNVQYYSPCHAGCSAIEDRNGSLVYKDCSCVQRMAGKSTNDDYEDDSALDASEAIRKQCTSRCTLMPAFLVILCFVMWLTFLIDLPAVSATLRCVPVCHRSFALGLQWIIVRLLGTIPGPIIFGRIIDNSCTLWEKVCGKHGACRLYNNFYMSRYMLAISMTGKVLSTVFFFFSAWTYYRMSKDDSSMEKPTVAPIHKNSSLTLQTSPSETLSGIDNPAMELSE